MPSVESDRGNLVIEKLNHTVGGMYGASMLDLRSCEIFASSYDKSCLRSAGYDIRASTTKLILPNGKRIPDGEHYDRPFVLIPGDTAFISSLERFHLPSDVCGLVSIKFSYASSGILMLMGMNVDPGYGSNQDDDKGLPLHFILANVGSEPLWVRPGEDRIASLQIMSVLSSKDSNDFLIPSHHTPAAPSIIGDLFAKNSDRPLGLSFFRKQAQVEGDMHALEIKVDHQGRGLTEIVMFGHFLLGTAIVGVVLTIILGWVGDGKIGPKVQSLIDVLPNTPYRFFSFLVATLIIFVGLPFGLTRVLSRITSITVRQPWKRRKIKVK